MISVVVPVYNSEQTLATLVSRIASSLEGHVFEILLIDDGSRDQSWQQVLRLAEGSPTIRGINLMRNYGQHNALLCGIREARGETIVTIDDDLQHPPEEIKNLLAGLTADTDVVYGSPIVPEGGWRECNTLWTTKWLL